MLLLKHRKAQKAELKQGTLIKELQPFSGKSKTLHCPNVQSHVKEKEESTKKLKSSLSTTPWFLTFAEPEVKELEISTEHSTEFIEEYGPKTWQEIYTFSSQVRFIPGPRNQYRKETFQTLLDTLKEYVKNWKTQSVPLILKGETGNGKTRCLQLLAKDLDLECICLHEVFIEQYTREEFKEKLLGFSSRGLNCTSKLWVIEHIDTLNEQLKILLLQAIPSMMKTGAVVCTSWPSSKEPSKKFKHLEFFPWTTSSKLNFLQEEWCPSRLRKWSNVALKESGENISSALCLSQLWSTSAIASLNQKEDSDEIDISYIPVNTRTLLEDSFTERWCSMRSMAVESNDIELSVQLLQEMIPMALVQGRCKQDMQNLVKSLNILSYMDSLGYSASTSTKTVIEQRLLQNGIRNTATSSLEKFNSGSFLPIPASFMHKSTKTMKRSRECIGECKTPETFDTRYYAEDIELFLKANKKQWKSPYSIK